MDYIGLETLDAIIRNQSFEKAALALHITQSAVSQRLNNLESTVGEKLMTRDIPYTLSEAGQRHLGLLRKVRLLEDDFHSTELEIKKIPTLRIALNSDSLELWFQDVLRDFKIAEKMILQIVKDDESLTITHLKQGRVDMCISTHAKPMAQYEAVYLGKMTYNMVASPRFAERYFPDGLTRAALRAAPAVFFDEKDSMHRDFLQQTQKFSEAVPTVYMPSVLGYKIAITAGFGYGLLPSQEIQTELKNKKIVNLVKTAAYHRPLYLHSWLYQPKVARDLRDRIITAAQSYGLS